MKKSKLGLLFLSSLALVTGVASTGVAGVFATINNTYVAKASNENTDVLYNWTAATADKSKFTSTTGVAVLNSKQWSYTQGNVSSTYNITSSCLQLGANGSSVGAFSLSSNETKMIKSVSVECSSYNASSKLTIKIGDTTYLAQTTTSKWTTVSSLGGIELETPISGELTISFTASSRALYLKSITINYAEDTSPNAESISIDQTDMSLSVGSVQSLSATVNPSTSSYSWSSSDETVAFVSSDGQVYGTKPGSAVITATGKGGEATDAINVSVSYPTNTKTLKEIIDTNDSNGGAIYYSSAIVDSISDRNYGNFVLTDGENVLAVRGSTSLNSIGYNISSSKFEYTTTTGFASNEVTKNIEAGSRIEFWCIRKDYTSGGVTTKQISAVIKRVIPSEKFTVTFDWNSSVIPSDSIETISNVSYGSTIAEPTSRTSADYIFDGWFADSTFNESSKWVFGESLVKSNLTLYAKWSKKTEVSKQIDSIHSYSALGYKYTNNGAESTILASSNSPVMAGDVVVVAGVFNTVESSRVLLMTEDSTVRTKALKAVSAGLSEDLIASVTGEMKMTVIVKDQSYGLKTNSGKYVSCSTGSTDLTLSTSPVYPFELKLGANGYGFYCGSRALGATNIDSDDGSLPYFKNYNSNNISAESSTYTQDVRVYKIQPQYTNVDFRVRLGIDSLIADVTGVEDFGMKLSLLKTDGTVDKAMTYSFVELGTLDEKSSKYMITLDLGDCLNNLDRATKVFKMEAYAVDENDETFLSASSKEFSVASMVNTYYNDPEYSDYKDTVGKLYSIFEENGLYTTNA